MTGLAPAARPGRWCRERLVELPQRLVDEHGERPGAGLVQVEPVGFEPVRPTGAATCSGASGRDSPTITEWLPRPRSSRPRQGSCPAARVGSSSTRARHDGASASCVGSRPVRRTHGLPAGRDLLVRARSDEPIGMYHWEADQEDFLVLSGEGLLLVEGRERPLRQWDFVHCPPGTNHIILGAGERGCAVLAVGARSISRPPPGAATPWTRSRSVTAPASRRRSTTLRSPTRASPSRGPRSTAMAGSPIRRARPSDAR